MSTNKIVFTSELASTIGQAIGKANASARDAVVKAEGSILPVLLAQAKLLPALAQGSKEADTVRKAIKADLLTRKYEEGSASALASLQAKIVLYMTNGYTFAAGNTHDAREEMKNAVVPFYTARASSGKITTKPDTKAAPVTDVKNILANLSGDEIFSIMSDAQVIAVYLATCKAKGLTPSKKLAA